MQTTPADEPYASLLEEFRAQRARLRMSLDTLADQVGWSRDTLIRRLADPATLKLHELDALARALGLPYTVTFNQVEVASSSDTAVA